MIRILHVLAKLNRAGTETMLMNFYRNIDRTEVQFDFAICTEEHCDYEDEILALGGHVFRYPQYKGTNHFQYKKWWNMFFIEHPEYRIIHGHIGSTAAIYLGIAKKYGCYTIAHSHGTKGQISIRSIVYEVYSYRTRYIADTFFGCSMAALISRYGSSVANDCKRAYVVNNSIDCRKFTYNSKVREEVRREFGLDTNIAVVGTVGRLAAQKNPFKTIEILKRLKERGIPFRFIWVGIGPLKDAINKAIYDNGLTDEILMTGVRSDIPRVLQAMDVFILPSVWEGLGIVAVEAQAAGLPTICSDTVPIEAQVSDECHFLPLNDVDRWVDSIVESLGKDRKDTSEQIIKAGYDIKATSEWLQHFYIRLYQSIK